MRLVPLALTLAATATAALALPTARAERAAAARAQQPRPAASPRGKAEGTVGAAQVSVDYGRPSKRGRVIFAADGLVPFGKVWRTGANEATTLVTSADLMIGTARVPKGTYSLYTIPAAGEWQLVINKQTGQWGTEYDAKQDLARVPMRVTKLGAPVEQFTIAVEPAAIVLRWDTMQASVPVRAAR